MLLTEPGCPAKLEEASSSAAILARRCGSESPVIVAHPLVVAGSAAGTVDGTDRLLAMTELLRGEGGGNVKSISPGTGFAFLNASSKVACSRSEIS
jgi:hypothetical protein